MVLTGFSRQRPVMLYIYLPTTSTLTPVFFEFGSRVRQSDAPMMGRTAIQRKKIGTEAFWRHRLALGGSTVIHFHDPTPIRGAHRAERPRVSVGLNRTLAGVDVKHEETVRCALGKAGLMSGILGIISLSSERLRSDACG